ncbi:hypothetical protein BpHYR1_023132 [Brachionus plicatilis]|uniref:Uncharacterized protein n=1 Tax=Brachionus plicatilis TaxID=10195 RepID=A0A3M7QGU3_BRAPC|nr:hypothetical protein BpHYR1_023132 [Brachionus plicatilis]
MNFLFVETTNFLPKTQLFESKRIIYFCFRKCSTKQTLLFTEFKDKLDLAFLSLMIALTYALNSLIIFASTCYYTIVRHAKALFEYQFIRIIISQLIKLYNIN